MRFLGVYQEKSSGKDGGAAVPEKESSLEEAGAMDAVLVNTHQVFLRSLTLLGLMSLILIVADCH
jgi:hypothetical protein